MPLGDEGVWCSPLQVECGMYKVVISCKAAAESQSVHRFHNAKESVSVAFQQALCGVISAFREVLQRCAEQPLHSFPDKRCKALGMSQSPCSEIYLVGVLVIPLKSVNAGGGCSFWGCVVSAFPDEILASIPRLQQCWS